MTTLVKTTQDGRKLEVIGLAICLDGELEAFELVEVKMHPEPPGDLGGGARRRVHGRQGAPDRAKRRIS